jgi:hypothetical protein
MSQDTLPELRPIQQAADGLEYPSESDAPFDLLHWPVAGAPSAREQVIAHQPAGRKIEEVALNDFFGELDESEDAERFTKLRQVLESQLKDLKIFRVGSGEVRVDIYVIGKAASGDWVALHTVSVET